MCFWLQQQNPRRGLCSHGDFLNDPQINLGPMGDQLHRDTHIQINTHTLYNELESLSCPPAALRISAGQSKAGWEKRRAEGQIDAEGRSSFWRQMGAGKDAEKQEARFGACYR